MINDDHTLSIDEVARLLNKSIRTIHRYKDGGRLSFVVGTTQGNPIRFSRREVEKLALALRQQPIDEPADPDASLSERLERVERRLERLLAAQDPTRREELKELGRLLVQLGTLLQEE